MFWSWTLFCHSNHAVSLKHNIPDSKESTRGCGMRNNIHIYSHVLIVTCVVLIVNCMLLVAPLPAPVCVGRLGSYNINSVYASATDGLVFN